MKLEVKCSTPGVTAAMHSRHSGTPRAALRASWHAWALGYRHSSITLLSMPAKHQHGLLVDGESAARFCVAGGRRLCMRASAAPRPADLKPLSWRRPLQLLTHFREAEEYQLALLVRSHFVGYAFLKGRDQLGHAIIARLELRGGRRERTNDHLVEAPLLHSSSLAVVCDVWPRLQALRAAANRPGIAAARTTAACPVAWAAACTARSALPPPLPARPQRAQRCCFPGETDGGGRRQGIRPASHGWRRRRHGARPAPRNLCTAGSTEASGVSRLAGMKRIGGGRQRGRCLQAVSEWLTWYRWTARLSTPPVSHTNMLQCGEAAAAVRGEALKIGRGTPEAANNSAIRGSGGSRGLEVRRVGEKGGAAYPRKGNRLLRSSTVSLVRRINSCKQFPPVRVPNVCLCYTERAERLAVAGTSCSTASGNKEVARMSHCSFIAVIL